MGLQAFFVRAQLGPVLRITMYKILNKKCGKATASYRVLYLPYVTLIWGDSAENRKGRKNAVKASNIQKYKGSIFISIFRIPRVKSATSPSFGGSICGRLNASFNMLKILYTNMSFPILLWAQRSTLNRLMLSLGPTVQRSTINGQRLTKDPFT